MSAMTKAEPLQIAYSTQQAEIRATAKQLTLKLQAQHTKRLNKNR